MIRLQKLVLMVSILASFVVFLDDSIVNVALPAILKELGGGLISQQWVVTVLLLAGGVISLIGIKKPAQPPKKYS